VFDQILQTQFFQNSVLDYLICISLFLIGIIVIQLFKRFILAKLKHWTERTSTTLDDFLVALLRRNVIPLLYFGVFYISVRNLTLNPALSKTIDVLGMALLTIFAIRSLVAVIHYGLNTYWLKAEKDEARERSL
jgi:hypothetical protein